MKKLLNIFLAVIFTLSLSFTSVANAATKNSAVQLKDATAAVAKAEEIVSNLFDSSDLSNFIKAYNDAFAKVSKLSGKEKSALDLRLKTAYQKYLVAKTEFEANDALIDFEIVQLDTLDGLIEAVNLQEIARQKIEKVKDITTKTVFLTRFNTKSEAIKALKDKYVNAYALYNAYNAVEAYVNAEISDKDKIEAAKKLGAKASDLVSQLKEESKKKDLENKIKEMDEKIKAKEAELNK